MKRGIAVIIPAFNAAGTIVRALESVRRQTEAPADVIVVDDGSTDATLGLASEFQGLPIRCFRNGFERGAAGARNFGIKSARTEYIAFLDADDEWLPTKLEKQLAVLTGRERMSFVSCRAVLVSPEGEEYGLMNADAPVATGAEAWKSLLARNFVGTPCVVARRSFLDQVGGFRPDLVVGEDQDLWIRLALAGEVGFVDEVLVRVHTSPRGLSGRNRAREVDIMLPMIRQHLEQVGNRLDGAARRAILGARYAKLGRSAVANGEYLAGARLVARSILLGERPIENLLYLLSSAPPAVALKERLRGSKAAKDVF